MTKKINIPAVEKLLEQPEIKEFIKHFGRDIVKNSIQLYLTEFRLTKKEFDYNKLITNLKNHLQKNYNPSLIKVINATGIILHTNLGRAPLGNYVINEIEQIATGYSNLEFDLNKAKRGNRNSHIRNLLKAITGAEDALVVNNNAAAVLLILQTLATEKEVIVSRGELIEIGGSFRIPDIMRTSGAKMVEVGTTNRTKLSDYENAITENTAILLKAHKSNYFIQGFTEEVELNQLSSLAKKHNLILYYDLGSGLLKKPRKLEHLNEPTVLDAIKSGADIVSFSGDKLLGGPQAGIIIGKSEFIKQIEKNPLMRALRVGKLTLAGVSAVIKSYLNDELLVKNLPIFSFLTRDESALLNLAKSLKRKLKKYNILSEIVKNQARCGGGTLPNFQIDSFAVKLILNKKQKASDIYKNLLLQKIPVLSILKQGNILFDVFALQKDELDLIADTLKK